MSCDKKVKICKFCLNQLDNDLNNIIFIGKTHYYISLQKKTSNPIGLNGHLSIPYPIYSYVMVAHTGRPGPRYKYQPIEKCWEISSFYAAFTFEYHF